MNQKAFIVLVCVGVLFLSGRVSLAHTGMHVISATSQNMPLKPHYYMAKHDVKTHKDGSATVVVTTEGDCEKPAIPFCTDKRDNGECKSYYHHYCEHETLYYPLPKEQVVFDGKKRLKFVGDGHYITLASHDRHPYNPFMREWNFYTTYSTLEDAYQHLHFLLYIKE